MAEVSVRMADARDHAAWERFVTQSPHACFAHSIRMKAVYEAVYGYRTAYWIAEEAGEITGLCPLVYVRSMLHWNRLFLVALPMVTAAGLLAGTGAARDALVARLEAFAAAEGAVVQLRNHRETALATGPSFGGYVTFTLPLAGATSAAFWDRLSSRNRGKIRKSRKAGTRVRFGGRPLLDDFFALHVRRNTELSTPPYPKAFFVALLDAFPRAEIAIAENAGRPVAGMFNIGHKGVMNYVFGSWDSRFQSSYRNNQLLYEVIERARMDGYDEVDLGRSQRDAGSYAFKQQWLAQERPLYYQYLGRDAARFADLSIARVRDSVAFRLFARVWSRCLPRAVIERLGPALIRRMPLA